MAPSPERLTRISWTGSAGGRREIEVDHAGHGARAVERGGNALDDFHLAEIHGRDLQQAESAALLSEKRKAVRQKAGVAAAHALDADAGGAERWRGGLHAQAAHFVQHHDDVAGRHHGLLFDLFGAENFDAGRRILQARVGAGGVNSDLLFHGGQALQFEDDRVLARLIDCDGCSAGNEALFLDADLHFAERHGGGGDSVAIRANRTAIESDVRVRDAGAAGLHTDANGRPRLLRERREHRGDQDGRYLREFQASTSTTGVDRPRSRAL